VLAIPGETSMLARVAYTGVPNGCGLSKEAVVLLSE
jgi:hypothetical protein